MKFSMSTLAAAALLVLAPTAYAESADLTVTGTIVPGGCVPSLSGGGVVDLGTILAASLNTEQKTILADRSVQLSVDCAAPARWALNVTDNRAETAYSGALNTLGLGLTSNNEKIGSYVLKFDPATVVGDGIAMAGRSSRDGGATWSVFDGLDLGFTSYLHGFSPAGGSGVEPPVAIQSFSGTLNMRPAIAPMNTLTIGDEIQIDGSVTIEIVML